MRVAVALLLLLAATPAFADRDEARREFAAGQAADARQEWSVAIEHYLRANDLVPHPFAMYNIAQDYARLGKLREAAHWYERYLTTDPKDRERVVRLLREIAARPGTITVTSNPDGARVSIDGAVVGSTPYSAPIKGGTHRVTVEQGTSRDEREVVVEFGEPASAVFTLQGATTATGATPLGTIDARPPDPNQRYLGYVFGFGAGADARGNGTGALTELGIRYKIVDATTRVGKTDGLLVVDFLVRVAVTNARLAPYFGAGWGFANDSAATTTTSSSGFLLAGGVRYDLARNNTYTVSVVGETGIRYYKGLSTSEDHTTLYVPITGTIQFEYHYPLRAGF